jgi:cleavage and polyadenylation specificity factor subunit 2
MDCGFARDLFLKWCSNLKNSVILTSRSSPGTLGRDFITNGGDSTIPIEVRRRIKLSGQEFDQYMKTEKSSSSKHHSRLVEEALDDESDSDTEMEGNKQCPEESDQQKSNY